MPGFEPKIDLVSMSLEHLWQLHDSIARLLSAKMESERRLLETRLAVIQRRLRAVAKKHAPKFQNPNNISQTWSGRGPKPHWLVAELEAGKRLDYFRIKPSQPREDTLPQNVSNKFG